MTSIYTLCPRSLLLGIEPKAFPHWSTREYGGTLSFQDCLWWWGIGKPFHSQGAKRQNVACTHRKHVTVRRSGLKLHLAMRMDFKNLVLGISWKKHNEMCHTISLHVIKILAEQIAVYIYKLCLKHMRMVADVEEVNRRETANKMEWAKSRNKTREETCTNQSW